MKDRCDKRGTCPQELPAAGQDGWGTPWYDGAGGYVWWGRPVLSGGRALYLCARRGPSGEAQYGWVWRDEQGRAVCGYPGEEPCFVPGAPAEPGRRKRKAGRFLAAFFATIGAAVAMGGLTLVLSSALEEALGWYDAAAVLSAGDMLLFLAGAVTLRLTLAKKDRDVADGILWGAVSVVGVPVILAIVWFGCFLILLWCLGFTGF